MDLAIRPPFKARRKVQTNAKEVYSTSVAQTDEDIRTFETLCGIDQTKDDLIEVSLMI